MTTDPETIAVDIKALSPLSSPTIGLSIYNVLMFSKRDLELSTILGALQERWKRDMTMDDVGYGIAYLRRAELVSVVGEMVSPVHREPDGTATRLIRHTNGYDLVTLGI